MDCKIHISDDFLVPITLDIYDSCQPFHLRFQMDLNNNNNHYLNQSPSQIQINNHELIQRLPQAQPILDFDDGTMETATEKVPSIDSLPIEWINQLENDDKIDQETTTAAAVTTVKDNNKVVRRNQNRAQNLLLQALIQNSIEKNNGKDLVNKLFDDLKKFTSQTFQWRKNRKLFDNLSKRIEHKIFEHLSFITTKTIRAIDSNQPRPLLFDSRNYYDEDRYAKEFQELERIGGGGNGKVNKVQHRVDKQQYAVKIIHLKQGQLDKLNREPIIYAQLSHLNVVEYKTSWIQNCSSTMVNVNDGHDHNDEPTTTSTGNNNLLGDDLIEIISSKSINDTKMKEKSKFFRSSNSSSSSSSSSSLSSSVKDNGTKMVKNVGKQTDENKRETFLFIQMELCGQNLRDYIENRNKSFKTIDNLNLSVELKWFAQILAGVRHIHDKQLIHRDLKPSNILFTLDGKLLKICDFGLSSWSLNAYYKPVQSSSSLSINNDHHLQTSLSFGMGTPSYAAPEQLKQSKYDHCVDIYSLGIILFELIYPYGSGMEKSLMLDKLKIQRILPSEFNENDLYKMFGKLILAMTERNPAKRIKTIGVIERKLSSIHFQLKRKPSNRKSQLTLQQTQKQEIIRLKREKKTRYRKNCRIRKRNSNS